MEFLKQPAEMEMDGDKATAWKRWKRGYDRYETATGCANKDGEVRIATFLHCIGEEAADLLETFELDANQVKVLDEIVKKYEEHFVGTSNPSVERAAFNMRMQLKGETFNTFLSEIKKMAARCDFGTMRDELVKDRIVCGIENRIVKERLLSKKNLTLDTAIQVCRAAEEAKSRVEKLREEAGEVAELRSGGGFHNKQRPVPNARKTNVAAQPQPRWKEERQRNSGSGGGASGDASGGNRAQRAPAQRQGNYGKQLQGQTNSGQGWLCQFCGSSHQKGKCAAYGKKCNACKKMNHFSRVCKNVHVVNNLMMPDIDGEDDNVPNFVLNALNNEHECKDWYVEVRLQDCQKTLKCKIDTGAQINVIPWYIFERLDLDCGKLNKKKMNVTNYGGEKLEVMGNIVLECVVNGKDVKIDFIVLKTDKKAAPIIGIDLIQNLRLLTPNVDSLTKGKVEGEFVDLFKGIGQIKGVCYDFKLKENYTPVVIPCRKIPFGQMKKVEEELKRMMDCDVITPIDEATEFVSPVVVVRKPNGQIRICLDPQNLNQALMREHYKIPTFEELSSEIAGSKWFTVLDCNKGFWQIALTEEASKLTTFSTPFGRYRFLRLPFGINIAPEIFHKTFAKIMEGIKGVKLYIDDLIIYAESEEEHDRNLGQVLERARKFGVKFNKDKCQIRVKEVKYVGHILSEAGIRVDDDKIKAILSIEPPKNTKALSRFLGMVTYVSKFVPHLSARTANLRNLMRKEVFWEWTTIHEEEFRNLKDVLTKSPVLQFYDEKKDIVLSVDSSKDGIGAVLLQDGLPVAYASKAMSETQKRYAQIEKETLAIVFGCTRFHQFLYGRRFIVETDHRPLVSIFKKPLEKCPLRLQRLRISLQSYEFELRYKPGKFLYISDALSRASHQDKEFEIIENNAEAQVDLIAYQNVSPKRFEEIKVESERDESLQELRKVITEGWPDSKKELKESVKPFWKVRDELVINQDMIFRGNQIVIPKNLRKGIIEALHYNHGGREKTIWRARETVYWPLINKEIDDVVKDCATCLTYGKNQQKEPLINENEIPDRPWQIVAGDFFTFEGEQYLLLVDSYSKFPELINFGNNTTNKKVVEQVKSVFARHGKPDIFCSDQGPQFVNANFQNFLSKWKVTHRTSTPHNPKSNGLVERHVQSIKNLLKKTLHDKKDVQLALLEYRNTPLNEKIPSPAVLLFGRRLKGVVPISEESLKPVNPTNVSETLKFRKMKEKSYYDRTAMELPELKKGEKVMVKDFKTGLWEPGKVEKVDENRPRSYMVKLDRNGKVYMRNRKFLKKANTHNFEKEIVDRMYEKLLEEEWKEWDTELDNNPKYDLNPNLSNNPENDSNQNITVRPRESRSDSARKSKQPNTNQSKTRSGRNVRRPNYLQDYVE